MNELDRDVEGDEGEVASPSSSAGEQRSLEETLLVARLLFWVGRVGDADRLLRPWVRRDPARPALYKLWAQIKHTQGHLTDAIRAIERMHALLPSEENALLVLEILRRIALLPETPRRELDLSGDRALVRAHRAHMDLEHAFRLAGGQKFTSAVALAEAIADRCRASDPRSVKLALLAKALFLETIGQLDGAILTLEGLASIRGLEGDRDRLLSLARVYERRGTPEDLARANRIWSFLYDRTGHAEYLSRLARIADRRGDGEEAARLRELFLRAFRKEQHELGLDELLEAASLQHVPLRALRALAPAPAELAALRARLEEGRVENEPRRVRRLALLLALSGENEAAAARFERLAEGTSARAVDEKYRADLREESGDATGAVELYLSAIAREPSADVAVLAKMLGRSDPEIDTALARTFADEDKRGRALEALRLSAKSNQLSPEVWRALAQFERLIGRAEDAARHEHKAEALARASARLGPRIGHVQVAAVHEVQGKKRGLVHEIWASRYRPGKHSVHAEGGQLDEGSIFGNVTGDMMRDIQNVFVAVRTFVEHRFPHLVEDAGEYRYVLKVTKEDEPSGGSSAGIAVALAIVSVFLQRPLPQDLAITGSLVADSAHEIRLHRVADVDHKVLGVYQRRLSRLIVPAENRVDLEASNLVPRPIWESRVAFARNLTQVMKLVFGDDLWEW